MSIRLLDALLGWAVNSTAYGWLGNKVVMAMVGKPPLRGEADGAATVRV